MAEDGFRMKFRLLVEEVIEIGGDIGGGMSSLPGEVGRAARWSSDAGYAIGG